MAEVQIDSLSDRELFLIYKQKLSFLHETIPNDYSAFAGEVNPFANYECLNGKKTYQILKKLKPSQLEVNLKKMYNSRQIKLE